MITHSLNYRVLWVMVVTADPFKVLNITISGQRPSIRTFHGAGLLGNRLVVVAGRNMSKRLNDTYCLDLSDLAPGGYRRRMSLRATSDSRNDLSDQIPNVKSKLYEDIRTKKTKITLQSFTLKVCHSVYAILSFMLVV